MAKNEAHQKSTRPKRATRPLIDLNDASIKKMIARAKKRGVVTFDELNEALPQDQMSSEQIEDVMSALNEMGINVVENAEDGDDEEDDKDDEPRPRTRSIRSTTAAPAPPPRSRRSRPTAPTTRSACTCARWARWSCSRREGEIAIAKRIEAGRDTMIWGLCESPITFNAIIGWSNALNEGRMQLREIIDLEAMLSKGPTAEQLNETEEGGEGAEGEISEKIAGPSIKEEEEVADEPDADAQRRRRGHGRAPHRAAGGGRGRGQHPLASPRWKRRSSRRRSRSSPRSPRSSRNSPRSRARRMDALQAGNDFPATDEKKYQKLREQLTAEVESVQFHGSKIEYLVDAALQLQPPPDRAWRPDAAPRRAPPRAAPGLPRKLHGP